MKKSISTYLKIEGKHVHIKKENWIAKYALDINKRMFKRK